VVRARAHREGIGATVRAGLRALRPREDAAFIFLGDMPRVPASLAWRMARALRPKDGALRPVHHGVPGHPVLVRRPSRAAIASVRGDRGLAPLLRGARTVAAPRGAVIDMDRRTDRARLR
ncbi:MAG: nucleotidyltransferase family protein, partial [Sphingomonas sp.]